MVSAIGRYRGRYPSDVWDDGSEFVAPYSISCGRKFSHAAIPSTSSFIFNVCEEVRIWSMTVGPFVTDHTNGFLLIVRPRRGSGPGDPLSLDTTIERQHGAGSFSANQDGLQPGSTNCIRIRATVSVLISGALANRASDKTGPSEL